MRIFGKEWGRTRGPETLGSPWATRLVGVGGTPPQWVEPEPESAGWQGQVGGRCTAARGQEADPGGHSRAAAASLVGMQGSGGHRREEAAPRAVSSKPALRDPSRLLRGLTLSICRCVR